MSETETLSSLLKATYGDESVKVREKQGVVPDQIHLSRDEWLKIGRNMGWIGNDGNVYEEIDARGSESEDSHADENDARSRDADDASAQEDEDA